MQNEFDVIIVGKGPAGISAALYVLRSGLSVLLLAKDAGALSRAHQIANYYGLESTISGQELAHRGEEQAKKLGAEVVTGEVVDLMFAEKLFFQKRSSSLQEQSVPKFLFLDWILLKVKALATAPFAMDFFTAKKMWPSWAMAHTRSPKQKNCYR